MVTHQSVSFNLSVELAHALKNCKKCQALFEIDWQVSEDTVVRPDNIVICYEPIETIDRKPEIIFEITSPTTVRRDERLKYRLYEEEGVLYYAILYPKKKVAKIYKLLDGRYVKVGDFSDEKVEFALKECTITLNIAKIWR